MQKNADLYNLTQQMQGAIYQAGMKHYAATPSEEQDTQTPKPNPLMTIRNGYAESIAWMMVQLYEFEPEALTVDTFRMRAVYSAPRLSQAILELIASEKWAHRVGEDYKLTNSGYAVIHNMLAGRNQKLLNFCPLPKEELDKLVDYSERIFASALDTDDEQSVWCLHHSQKRKPIGKQVTQMPKLLHVCSDMNAWRDDTHMQAYREQGVDGMTWEAFSFVDDKTATTAETLFDQLAYRGWTVTEWQSTLDELANNGWIIGDETGYTSTDTGKSIRQIVESKTDTLFFAPWETLSQEEQVDYVRLLHKLNDVCMGMLSA